jgi:hypothetical protein
MKGNKEIISVSTDIAGPFGKPEDVVEVYSDCRSITDFGLEVICWREINKAYFNKIGNLGMKVNGLHGPINAAGESSAGSWLDRLKGHGVDMLMIGNNKIQEVSRTCPQAYFLIHERIVNSPKKIQEIATIAQSFDKETILLIENLNDNGSITKTVEAVEELSKNGVKTGILIDLVHLIKDMADSLQPITVETTSAYWSRAISEISKIMSKTGIVGFHIPVGLNLFDSLPVSEMDKQLWVDFAQLTAESPVRFKTIENQRVNSRTPFRISEKEMAVLKPRNYQIMSELHEYGVI